MSNILKKFTYILDNANRSHVWPALAILVLTLIFFRNFMFTAEAPAGIDAKGFISRPWYLFQNGEIWSLWHSQLSFGFIRLPTVATALAILYSIVNDPVLGLKIFAVGALILSAALNTQAENYQPALVQWYFRQINFYFPTTQAVYTTS